MHAQLVGAAVRPGPDQGPIEKTASRTEKAGLGTSSPPARNGLRCRFCAGRARSARRSKSLVFTDIARAQQHYVFPVCGSALMLEIGRGAKRPADHHQT